MAESGSPDNPGSTRNPLPAPKPLSVAANVSSQEDLLDPCQCLQTETQRAREDRWRGTGKGPSKEEGTLLGRISPDLTPKTLTLPRQRLGALDH